MVSKIQGNGVVDTAAGQEAPDLPHACPCMGRRCVEPTWANDGRRGESPVVETPASRGAGMAFL